MKAVSLAAASLVAAIAITTAGSAMAQIPTAATQSTPYGQVGDAAYPPPPGPAPAGSHYEWIFGYDRHGDYLGHWTLVRNN